VSSTGNVTPIPRRHGTGRAGVMRQAMHSPSTGRVFDCRGTSADGRHPAPFSTARTDDVGWAQAQFPPCPLLARTVPDLVEAMWALRRWADNPSYRVLERRAERIERKAGTVRALPHATLHRVMTRSRMPRLEILELFVKACGAGSHWDEWRRAWFEINANLHVASLRRRGHRSSLPR
jgi:hypothetical protein